MTDYLFESIGDQPLPAQLANGDTSPDSLDSARATLAGLFAQALNSELGAAWTRVIASMPGSSVRFAGTTPVSDTLQLKPTAELLSQRKTGFPLLCVYREGQATIEQHTISADKLTQKWGVDWIIGRVDTNEMRRLGDFPLLGARVLSLAIKRRGHPDYDSGTLQFFPGNGGLGDVALKAFTTEPMALNKESGPDWLILQATLETVEYGRWDEDAFAQLDYATFSIGVGDDTGIIHAFVEADSRYPEGDPRP